MQFRLHLDDNFRLTIIVFILT